MGYQLCIRVKVVVRIRKIHTVIVIIGAISNKSKRIGTKKQTRNIRNKIIK